MPIKSNNFEQTNPTDKKGKEKEDSVQFSSINVIFVFNLSIALLG